MISKHFVDNIFKHLKGFIYFYPIRIILFTINHLFVHCLMFYFKQLSLAYVHSLNVKQFYLTHR